MTRRMILIAVIFAALIGAAAGGAYAQSTEPRFILTGVVFVEGGTGGRAWLQEPTITQNQVINVRRGDSIGPYRLTSIFEDRVELEGPNGKVSVPLAGVGGPATVAGSATGPAPKAALGAVPPEAPRPPTGPEQTVDTRTDQSRKFDFKNLPSLFGGTRN